MVTQTISTNVIRQALNWANIRPTRVVHWANNPFGHRATSSSIILVFDRFTANNAIVGDVITGDSRVDDFVQKVRDSFAEDVHVVGWNYNPLHDRLKIMLEHYLVDEVQG